MAILKSSDFGKKLTSRQRDEIGEIQRKWCASGGWGAITEMKKEVAAYVDDAEEYDDGY